MVKKGEKLKSFALHAVFVLAILAGLYFIVVSTVNLTGYAVLDAETAGAKLESALSSSSSFSAVSSGSICVVINDADQPLSLQAEKSSAGWSVTETTGYCSGLSSEDVVVQFPDYDSFSQIVDNPSPKNIANGAINRDFEILESKYVELGGNVICDAEFKAKYCDALKSMTTANLLIEGDMSCCLEKLTSSQKKQLAAHLEQGGFRDETGTLQQPGATGLFGLISPMVLIIVVVVILVGVGVVLMLKGKGRAEAGAGPGAPGAGGPAAGAVLGDVSGEGMPGAGIPGAMGAAVMPSAGHAAARPTPSKELSDLQDYVDQVILQGYGADEVRSHLLEIGWDQSTAESVVEKAMEKLQGQK